MLILVQAGTEYFGAPFPRWNLQVLMCLQVVGPRKRPSLLFLPDVPSNLGVVSSLPGECVLASLVGGCCDSVPFCLVWFYTLAASVPPLSPHTIPAGPISVCRQGVGCLAVMLPVLTEHLLPPSKALGCWCSRELCSILSGPPGPMVAFSVSQELAAFFGSFSSQTPCSWLHFLVPLGVPALRCLGPLPAHSTG